MRNEVMWAVRDAQGLSTNEKALLWAIESCGTAKKHWEGMAAMVGMSKDSFYRTRASLLSKGLIRTRRKYNSHTEYTVILDLIHKYENGDSHTENNYSHQTETNKKNTKKKEKKNIKEQEHTDAKAPVETKDTPKVDTPDPSLDSMQAQPALGEQPTASEIISEVSNGNRPWKARTRREEPEEVLEEAW